MNPASSTAVYIISWVPAGSATSFLIFEVISVTSTLSSNVGSVHITWSSSSPGVNSSVWESGHSTTSGG